MANTNALKRIADAAEMFDNCKLARAKLGGHELTVELFDEINGVERGLENLLGRPVDILGESAEVVRSLKSEIFEALLSAETEAGKEMRAAIECMCEDLVKAVQTYDTSSDNVAALKGKLIEKLKGMDDTAVTTLLGTKIEGVIYQYSQAIEFCEIVDKFAEFLDTDTCNLGRLTEISKINGGDMSDDDKAFLKNISDAVDENTRAGMFSNLWTIRNDAVTDTKLSAVGYSDKSKIVDLINKLSKSEARLFKLLRKIREALCKDCDTTDAVCVKNNEFWCTVDSMLCYTYSIVNIRNGLWEQFALIDKTVGVVAPAPTPDDTQSQETQTSDNGAATGDGDAQPQA